MIRNRILASLVGVCGLFAAAGSARAQETWGEFPGIGVADMMQAELQFQDQFYRNAWIGAQYVAAVTPDDQPLGIDAMTISRSNMEAAAAGERYIHSIQHNSDVALDAVGRTTVGGIRDNWHYAPEGQPEMAVELPYGPEAYIVDNTYVPEDYQQFGQTEGGFIHPSDGFDAGNGEMYEPVYFDE